MTSSISTLQKKERKILGDFRSLFEIKKHSWKAIMCYEEVINRKVREGYR